MMLMMMMLMCCEMMSQWCCSVCVCTESEWVGAASRHQSSSYPLTALHCHRDAHDLIAAHHCQSLQLTAAAAVSCLSVNVLARIHCVASRCKMSLKLNWSKPLQISHYMSVCDSQLLPISKSWILMSEGYRPSSSKPYMGPYAWKHGPGLACPMRALGL